jgi:transcriptional regulator with PAS, ATPase and Fis domain
VGRSPAIQKLIAKIEKISRYRTNVLLLGESGTGKELVARTIHRSGPRANKRFEPQNCATLSAELLASELFGHEQGSFTGAHTRKIGLFEVADGGTLLLDEIGEMDIGVQAKLLRVLEMRRFRRLGGTELHDLDLSIIAATNRALPELIADGRFRADLYYRLKVVTITVPTLRDRREDIPLLAESFIRDFNARHGAQLNGLSARLMKRFLDYPWPGNVRELRNTIESMGVVCTKRTLDEDDAEEAGFGGDTPLAGQSGVVTIAANATLAEAEHAIIMERMRCLGSKVEVAKSLGIGLRTLYTKLSAADAAHLPIRRE